jgi:multidrug efflux pump subunit AcrA (membrane-fusion protein)
VDLFARKTISEQQRDNTEQQSAAAAANVQAQRAAAKQAEVNLSYIEIKSPIDGIAGLVKVQVGDLVGPSTGVLTTVSTMNPIKAVFTVSDQRYVAYSQRWANDPEARAEHERQLEYELIMADGSRFPEKGRLFAVDAEVDLRTGSQQIVAISESRKHFASRAVRSRQDALRDPTKCAPRPATRGHRLARRIPGGRRGVGEQGGGPAG